MGNEDIKLNFAHVCENAFLSQDGKINIIGDFDKIKIAKLNGKVLLFPFFVVTNFLVKPEIAYKQEVSLFRTSDSVEIFKKEVTQTAVHDKIGLIIRADTKISSAGEYKIIIKINGIEYHKIKINIDEKES